MGLVAPRHVGSSQTRARTRVPCIGRQTLNHCATREAHPRIFWGWPFWPLVSVTSVLRSLQLPYLQVSSPAFLSFYLWGPRLPNALSFSIPHSLVFFTLNPFELQVLFPSLPFRDLWHESKHILNHNFLIKCYLLISLSLSSQFLILSTDYRQLLPFFFLPVDLTSGHHFMIKKKKIPIYLFI